MHSAVKTSYEEVRGCGYRSSGGLYLMADGETRGCGKLPLPLEVCAACGHGVKPSRGWTWVDPQALFANVECNHVPVPRFIPAEGPESRSEMYDACSGCPLRTPDGTALAVGDALNGDDSPESGVGDTRGTADLGPVGLIWVGERFYARPSDFLEEVGRQGFSRRIPAVPKAFVAGETWVLVAHRKGVEGKCEGCGGSGIRPVDGGIGEPCDAEGCEGGRVYTPAVFGMYRPDRIEAVVEGNEPDAEIDALVKRGLQPVKVVRLDEAAE